MKKFVTGVCLSLALASTTVSAETSFKSNSADLVRKTAENQIRNLLEPLLAKYCRDECKLLSVNAMVDLVTADELTPGFDQIDTKKGNEIAPTSAQAKILIDDKVGPVSRGKLL